MTLAPPPEPPASRTRAPDVRPSDSRPTHGPSVGPSPVLSRAAPLSRVAPPRPESSAASGLARSDGSLEPVDSVAFAGISLTRTVPSSSPRPASVTRGGCPQYPALRRRTTRCSRSQHGPDRFWTGRNILPSLLTRRCPLESKTPASPTGLNQSVARAPRGAAPAPGRTPWTPAVHQDLRPLRRQGRSAGNRQLEPDRLARLPGACTPGSRGTGHQLQTPAALVVDIGRALARRIGQGVGDLDQESTRGAAWGARAALRWVPSRVAARWSPARSPTGR